ALKPIVPPAQHFLQKPDLRARKREMRVGMGPWSDETLARRFQSLEQAWNCILVTVGPTANGVHCTLNRVVILAYRSVAPIRVAPWMMQPKCEEQRDVL